MRTSAKVEPDADAAPLPGRYRIAAVAQLTGVPEPTLRAWERRYGIPSPERTSSGYRLYSDAEIRVVRELRRLCTEGMAAAEAASLLRSPPVLPSLPAPRAPDAAPKSDVATDLYDASAGAILRAVQSFDARALGLELRRAMFLGSATTLLDRVLAPVLRTVGDRWHSGELSVAQEHLASQQIGTTMRDLLRLLPGNDGAESAVLACFADDEHELGLLGVALRFASSGVRPLFLGARTPPEALESAIGTAKPRLVALSVTVAPEPRRARELVDQYAAVCARTPWIVGGRGAARVASRVRAKGGTVLDQGDDAVDGPSLHAWVTRHTARTSSEKARRART